MKGRPENRFMAGIDFRDRAGALSPSFPGWPSLLSVAIGLCLLESRQGTETRPAELPRSIRR